MDIKKIEKNKGEEHSVVLDNLTQNYDANGQPRQSVLNVVRIKTNKKEEEVSCRRIYETNKEGYRLFLSAE